MTEDHILILQGRIGGRMVGRNTCINVTKLSSTEVSIYLEYISVAPYILEEACDRRSYPYTTRQNRWKNGR